MDASTRAVYESRAEEWARRRPPRLVAEAAALAAAGVAGLPVADLGCGPGSYFASLGRPLVALDASRAMLQVARRADPTVALVLADLAALPLAPGSLGGAWARASYLHLPRAALPVALAQLHRALAAGAPLEMTLQAGDGEGPRADDDFPGRFFAQWQPGDLAAVVVGAGFELPSGQEPSGQLSPGGLAVAGEWITVRGRRATTLPDFVGPEMDVLVCGLNPSVFSAHAGFGYARGSNRFWRAAVGSGLVAAERACRPLAVLAEDQVGMTDLVKRATPRADLLTPFEYRQGWDRLSWLARWLRPRVVLFVGLAGWRAAVDRHAQAGWQPPVEALDGAAAYVMPSTSGLNAATSLEGLTAHMAAAVAGGRAR